MGIMSTLLCVFFGLFAITVAVSPDLADPDFSIEALVQRIQRIEEHDLLQLNEIHQLKERDREHQNVIQQLKERDREKQNEIQQLKERDQEQHNEIKQLNERDWEHQNTIQQLKERDREQQNEIQQLKERDREQQNEIQQLKERDREQQNEIQQLKESDREQQNEIQQLKESDREQQNNTIAFSDKSKTNRNARIVGDDVAPDVLGKGSLFNRITRAGIGMDVAFFATLTDHQMNIGAHQAIEFDHVITNIGNAYHSHSGTFIAPVPGTYVFAVSLFSGWGQETIFAISKNGAMISQIYNDGRTGYWATGSQTFILELSQNDEINIRNTLPDRNTHGGHFSTFAGFLLQLQNPELIVG